MLLASAVCLALVQPYAARVHPNSHSTSVVTVVGARAEVTLRCQVLSLLEVIDALDPNEDGFVESSELEARRAEVFGYCRDHYRLTSGADREFEGGAALDPVLRNLSLQAPNPSASPFGEEQWVDLALEFEAGTEITSLVIEMDLFFDTSPAHIDIATVRWDTAERAFLLSRTNPRVRWDPTGRGVLLAFVQLGFGHILGGWDHLAFLAALLLGARRLWALFGVVTAFTAAHSITLGLSALGVLDLGRHAGIIEAVIALSIAYVAADNLLHQDRKSAHWPEAFVFGLVHGLGFAGFLGRSLVAETARLRALFGFNVGVELGQLLVVGLLAALLVGCAGARRAGGAQPFLAPPLLRTLGNGLIVVLGLYWFVERTWF